MVNLRFFLDKNLKPKERKDRNGNTASENLGPNFRCFFALGTLSVGGKQEHGQELCADFYGCLPALNFHLAVLPFEVF